MKRAFIFAVLSLFFSIATFSQIIVYQGGKEPKVYPQKSKIVISGKETTRVLYDGVLIIIPKGQKRQVSIKQEGREVVISGTNLKSIEAVGKSFSSNGNATVYISLDVMKITKVKGNAFIDQNGYIENRLNKNRQMNNKKQSFDEDLKAVSDFDNEEDFPQTSDYVNDVASQQTAQDVEMSDLSTSSPR